MNKIIFPLNATVQGPPVDNLQEVLQECLRRTAIPAIDENTRRDLAAALSREEAEHKYGDTTAKLVSMFQKARRLEPSGEVDEPTANALNALLKQWGLLDQPAEPVAPQSSFVVRGQVRYTNGKPATDVLVRAYDKDMRKQQELGKARTENDGDFTIPYSQDKFSHAEKSTADIFVIVSDADDQELARSQTVYNAAAEQTIDLTIRSNGPAPSEFERLLSEIEPLLKGQGDNGEDLTITELNDTDIEFITKETGIPSEQVSALVNAFKAARESVSVETPEVLTHLPSSRNSEIPAEAFYGWFHNGQRQSFQELVRRPTDELMAKLEDAIEQNYIPGISQQLRDMVRQRLDTHRIDEKLRPANAGEPASLGDILNTLPGNLRLTSEQQRLVSGVLDNGKVDFNDLPAKLKANNLKQAQIRAVLRTIGLRELTLGHAPLVAALQQTKPDERGAAMLDLAGYGRKDWEALVTKAGVPKYLEAPAPDKAKQAYVDQLMRNVELRMPSAYIASRIRDGRIPLKAAVIKPVLKFFEKNPDFRFGDNAVVGYFSQQDRINLDGVSSEDIPVVLNELMRVERVARVSPTLEVSEHLLALGYSSARHITRKKREVFIKEVADRLPGGRVTAEKSYNNAMGAVATAMGFLLTRSPIFNRNPDLPVTPPTSALGEQTEGDSAAVRSATAQPLIATVETLLGNQDYCDCQPCTSMYSQAAYFVELLHMLDRGVTNDAKRTALDVLLDRRPDLAEIELTCDNSNITLPYLDLVLELLESQLASDYYFNVLPRGPKDANGDRIDWGYDADLDHGTLPAELKSNLRDGGIDLGDAPIATQLPPQPDKRWILRGNGWRLCLYGFGNPAALRVLIYPQSVAERAGEEALPRQYMYGAYEALQVQRFPWSLPFDMPYEETAAWLDSLGTKRREIVDAYSGESRWTSLDAACEVLGINNAERPLFLEHSVQPFRDWGFTTLPGGEGWNNSLQDVSLFRKRAGVTHRELLQLLEARFIQQSPGIAEQIVISGDECDSDKMKLGNSAGLAQSVLRRFFLFIRLGRKLGWSVFDFDRAIRVSAAATEPATLTSPAVNSSEEHFTAAFFIFLANIVRLRELTNLTVEEIANLYRSKLDTQRYWDHSGSVPRAVPSLYERLFYDPAVARPRAPALELNAASTELQPLDPSREFPRLRISDYAIELAAALSCKVKDILSILPIAETSILPVQIGDAGVISKQGTWISVDGVETKQVEFLVGQPLDASSEFRITVEEEGSDGSINPVGAAVTVSKGVHDWCRTVVPYAGTAKRLRVKIDRTAGNETLWVSARVLTSAGLVNDLLNLTNLSQLCRHILLSRGLKIPASEYVTLVQISGLNPLETPGQTLAFADIYCKSKSAGLSVSELDFILRHRFAKHDDADQFEQRIIRILSTFRTRLQTEDASLSPVPGKAAELLRKLLLEVGWPDRLVNLALGAEFLDKTFPIEYVADVGLIPAALVNVLPTGLLYDETKKQLRWQGLPRTANSALINAENTLQSKSEYTSMPDEDKSRINQAFDVLEAATLQTEDTVAALLDPLTYLIQSIELPVHSASYPASSSPAPAAIAIPKEWSGVFWYEPNDQAFKFLGPMTEAWKQELSALSDETVFGQAVDSIFHTASQYVETGDNRLVRREAQTADGCEVTAEILFGDCLSLQDRSLRILERLIPVIRDRRARRIAKDVFTNELAIDADQADTLIERFRHTENGTESPLITRNAEDSWLLMAAFARSDAAVAISATAFPAQFRALARLAKLALIASRTGLTGKQLQWLFGQWQPSSALFDFSQLPVVMTSQVPTGLWGQWLSLATLIGCSKGISGSQPLDLSAIQQILLASDADADKIRAVAVVIGTQSADLERLVVDLNLSSASSSLNPSILKQVLDCLDLVHRTGADAATLHDWSQPQTLLASATSARRLARARVGEAQWMAASRPILDKLRIRRRDALVDYWIRNKLDLRDANELYGKLLIDPEMGPCMMTSRITQAINSVQLFIHRVLMGLERKPPSSSGAPDPGDVPPSAIDPTHWEWMKNYRVWEANRKVLLYPENWIEPELRVDKTPIYAEVESQQSQGEITNATSQLLVTTYLSNLDGVARLEAISTCREMRDDGTEVIHVIGKTRSDPREYFYRCFSKPAETADLHTGRWSPWTKIGLDLESDPIPYVVKNHLYVFWLDFTQKAAEDENPIPDKGSPPKSVWSIKLNWSCFDGGKWRPKKEAPFWSGNPAPDKLSQATVNSFLGPETFSLVPIKATFADAIYLVLYGTRVRFDTITWLEMNRWAGAWTILFDGDSVRTADTPETLEDSLDPGQAYLGRYIYDPVNLPFSEYVRRRNSVHQVQQQESRGELETVTVTEVKLPILIPDNIDPWPVLENSDLPMTIAFPVEDGIYRFIAPQGEFGVNEPAAFFTNSSRSDSYFAYPSYLSSGDRFVSKYEPQIAFAPFFHPQSSRLRRASARVGIDEVFRMGSLHERDWPDSRFNTFGQLSPNKNLVPESTWPDLDMEFSAFGAYAGYNWELFFHLPLSIAVQLKSNQRFSDSRRWFHYIFDPTDGSDDPTPSRYWRFRPLREQGPGLPIADLIRRLGDKSDHSKEKQDLLAVIQQWRDNPFEPHLVARMRPRAYMYAVIMKYLDNLIAWADQLFRRDSMESLNEATQLYILAAQILGRRPEAIPRRSRPVVKSFSDLRPDLSGAEGALGNPLVAAENLITSTDGSNTSTTGQLPPTLYFCVPNNPKLLDYYDTVQDRLFKLRNCMNIDGIVRQPRLSEPAIDPGLLVKARAAGIDLADILADANVPLPYYRFTVMAQKATELCTEVKALGSTLLSTIEKGDSEGLALLRSKHELGVLSDVRRIKELQVEEARAAVEALGPTLESAQGRLAYYVGLVCQLEDLSIPTGTAGPTIQAIAKAAIDTVTTATSLVQAVSGPTDVVTAAAMETLNKALSRASEAISESLPEAGGSTAKVPMNPAEKRQLAELKSARDEQDRASALRDVARFCAMLPDITLGTSGTGGSPVITAQLGGTLLSKAAELLAGQSDAVAAEHTYRANLASILAGYQRRAAEWAQQATNAQREIEQIVKQIATAGVRASIAAQELRNHDRQIENAQEIDDFMVSKYSNQELYNWMTHQISGVYFRAYQSAYDVAKRAERAYRYELGVTDSNFIQFGYWDSLKKGLLAGEKLSSDLKRMEVAYLEHNKREYEITKHVSLLFQDPTALITLKETGRCEVSLPEAVFDADYPGHYMRRIKSVSVTIPCVVGPYTSMNCTLTLLSNKTRISNVVGDQYPEKHDVEDNRFVTDFAAMQSIATSHGQNDNGMFELNFRDERYLPFEGAGLVESTWRIDLPKDCNAFDFETISDVIFTIKYTAREGGEVLRTAAKAALANTIKNAATSPLVRLFSLRHEFPTEWHCLSSVADTDVGRSQVFTIPKNRFPFLFQANNIPLNIFKVDLYVVPKMNATNPQFPKLEITVPTGTAADLAEGESIGGLPAKSFQPGIPVDTEEENSAWTFKLKKDDVAGFVDNVQDLLMVCHYNVGS